MLVTGDRADVAEAVGRIVGVDAVLADCDPADKLAVIRAESGTARTIMVGDGVNDAPALAAAGVGVALAARGATASSEAADVVLTVDRVDALADAILIARRSRRIALQAVVVGMGLSLVAMVAAAAGLLPPAAGAVLQEGIDVLAIAIALRALLPGRLHTIAMSAGRTSRPRTGCAPSMTSRSARSSRSAPSPTTSRARASTWHPSSRCSSASSTSSSRTSAPTRTCSCRSSTGRCGTDATATMRRTHAEIEHQVGRLRRLVADLDGTAASTGGSAPAHPRSPPRTSSS